MVLRHRERELQLPALLDSGASLTALPVGAAEFLGFRVEDLALSDPLITAGEVLSFKVAVVEHIGVLGCWRRDLAVLVHNFPAPMAQVGIVGLNFLHGLRLALDLHENYVELVDPAAPP